MALSTKMLKQDAVLWPAVGKNDFGEELLGGPEAVRVRWPETALHNYNDESVEEVDQSEVFISKRVEPGSRLWLGKLEDLPSKAVHPEAQRVMRYDRIPTLSQKQIYHIVRL